MATTSSEMELPGRTRQQAASYYSTVDFDVLGPVRVLREGVPVHLKGPKQRAILAVLVAHAGRSSSPDELIDAVWGEEPRPAARATLQSHISRIRTELGDVIVFEGGGYRLMVDRDRIDSQRFENAVERAPVSPGDSSPPSATNTRSPLPGPGVDPGRRLGQAVVVHQQG